MSAPGEPPGEPPAGQEPPAVDGDPQEPRDDGQSGRIAELRREAARHRVALRAAEAERDALRGRVERRVRADIERLAGERLADPSDVWLTAGVGDFVDDAGDVDAEKAAKVLDGVLEKRPHWAKPSTPVDFGAGVRPPAAQAPSFGEALKGAARR